MDTFVRQYMDCCNISTKSKLDESINFSRIKSIPTDNGKKIVESKKAIGKLIIDSNLPFTSCGLDLMLHSPVGNHSKFITSKADIALSGYCTAPEAAIKYAYAIIKYGINPEIETINSFNAGPTMNGILTTGHFSMSCNPY